MDLALTEQQEMLRKSARQFFEQECPAVLVKELEETPEGFSREVWRKFADLGYLGLVYPEKYGGMGGNFIDLAILGEEIGRAAFVGPFQTCVVQSGLLLLELGSDQQRQKYLPRIASGELILSFALTEPSGSFEASGVELDAKREGDSFVLNGTKMFIQYAASADYLLVMARTRRSGNPEDGLSVLLVDAKSPSLTLNPLRTIAEDKQCEVLFKDAAVPAANLVGPLHQAWPAVRKVSTLATLSLCAEMAGGTRAAMEYAAEYAKVRVQFGRPIGSFQAIQHYCANMLIDADAMRYLVYDAAWRVSAGKPYELEVSMCKALCSEAYQRTTAKGHQILGGVGFYKEMDMQLWHRRSKAYEVLFGDADYHRQKVADLMPEMQ